MILRSLIHRLIARFERRFDYDMGYARAIVDTSQRAFLHYALMGQAAAFRGPLPLDVWYTAKIVAARAEDCGPCTQLVLDMAAADGLPASLGRAVWRGDPRAMSEDVRLAWRYAEAAIARAPDIGDWRDAVERRWGHEGLVALALSMTASRTFPMLKYALGHGQACRAVRIDGQTLTVPPPTGTAEPAPDTATLPAHG